MRQLAVLIFIVFLFFNAIAQTPKTYTSSEILLQLKKLNVLGSVLYIAAHPDDENTRLLGYLANEKLYRTGYLSMTRGDGGQNLIGDEQNIDLGLIRTQELLSARRIDGAEQFFSRAYDFGYCKTPEEALATWGHDKILSDVVWVVRKFRPDVIIARFPEDIRAGHGHHAASGILAREAFDAAADPTKFPEQLQQGVTVWQAKRMLWNTFNFGGTSTQNESQFKVDVGMYNPLLGKSYGEIAALSRSQHKSQGFGVPAQRGTVIEYFETIKGDKPVNDLADGVDMSWGRVNQKSIEDSINKIIAAFNLQTPAASVKSLVRIYNSIQQTEQSYWQQQKQKELQSIIENASGLFVEATASNQYAVQGDTIKITTSANNRLGISAGNIAVSFFNTDIKLDSLKENSTVSKTTAIFIRQDEKLSQPYWLEVPMEKGSFNVSNQQLIGKGENDPLSASFKVTIEGTEFNFIKPIRYKFTDPVKGEIYQPVSVLQNLSLKIIPEINIGKSPFAIVVQNMKPANSGKYNIVNIDGKIIATVPYTFDKINEINKTIKEKFTDIQNSGVGKLEATDLSELSFRNEQNFPLYEVRHINYDHIPAITYLHQPLAKRVAIADFKIVGKSVGYIPGSGDKVPQALEQMGYKVTLLKEADITTDNLKQFDAIITGVRAYNTNDWMNNVYDELMQFVNAGGVLLVQYNTSNQIGPVKARIAPYPFNIGRTRITDETAKVNFLLPNHPALNYPNKISDKDFDGWIQERSIYHAEKIDSSYQRIFSMKDPGEKDEQDGSLIIANYGKGKFVYTGLVFFRELPAGVPGAYRLFANLLAPLNLPSGETLKHAPIKNSLLNSKKNVL